MILENKFRKLTVQFSGNISQFKGLNLFNYKLQLNMIFNQNVNTMNRQKQITQTVTLPSTVLDMTTEGHQHDVITVLDLTNPNDLALVTEAGYSIYDLSASMSSVNSEASSDTVSIATDDMSDLDPDIAKAAAHAAETGSIIPLLKEELKYTIQKRRLEKGQDWLKVENNCKRQNEQLTDEEEERRKRRRERNKVAAQKCRSKRREQGDLLEMESVKLENSNESLKEEIEKLEEEKEMLLNMLRTHDVCPRSCKQRLSTSSTESQSPRNSMAPQDFGVQMELDLAMSPAESPFNVDLIGAEEVVELYSD